MIVWKPIKPSKLRSEIFTAALYAAAEEYSGEILLDLAVYTAYWEHDPGFQTKVSITSHGVQIEIVTDDEIFKFLEYGTKEHLILPKDPNGVLAFQAEYSAKTIPGQITSRPGGASGDTVFSRGVIHPGTEPRLIMRALTEKHFIPFREAMQSALNQAAKESGHSL